MDTTAERTVSGRAIVAGGLVVVAIVTAIGVLFGPGLREQVRQEQRPRTLREPIASGTAGGQVWEAVGRYDGTANCVELRHGGEVVDRACDTGPQLQTTTLDGVTVVYGVAPESTPDKNLLLDNGQTLVTPVVAGELGFPVGFWAVELPEGTEVLSTQN